MEKGKVVTTVNNFNEHDDHILTEYFCNLSDIEKGEIIHLILSMLLGQ